MKPRSHASTIIACLLAVIATAVWMISDRSAPAPAGFQPEPVVSNAPVPASLQPVAMALPAPPIPPDLPPPKPRVVPSPEALKDIEDIQFMLRDYRTRLGDNPTGTNAEIMKEVMGGNRVQARLGPPEGQKLNDQGELLDRWGAPYFFHQLSKNEMEIRSAGPDLAMWTNDDIVAK
jgi:hypothetical protein